MTQSSSEIILRDYRSADATEIRDIYAHYVKSSVATFDIEAPSVDEISAKFEALVQAGHPVIIAECNQQVIGYAYASTFRSRPAYRFTCESAIYMSPTMAGRGVGSLLMVELIEKSRKFGFNQMVAIITMGTQSSIAIHRKFGFEILGEFPELGFKFNKWHGIVHMQLKL